MSIGRDYHGAILDIMLEKMELVFNSYYTALEKIKIAAWIADNAKIMNESDYALFFGTIQNDCVDLAAIYTCQVFDTTSNTNSLPRLLAFLDDDECCFIDKKSEYHPRQFLSKPSITSLHNIKVLRDKKVAHCSDKALPELWIHPEKTESLLNEAVKYMRDNVYEKSFSRGATSAVQAFKNVTYMLVPQLSPY